MAEAEAEASRLGVAPRLLPASLVSNSNRGTSNTDIVVHIRVCLSVQKESLHNKMRLF